MRLYVPAILALALAACDPAVPDSGSGPGVGFDGYTSYEQQRAEREAQLRRQKRPPAGVISDETVATAPQTTATAPQTTAPVPQQTPPPAPQQTVQTRPAAPTPPPPAQTPPPAQPQQTAQAPDNANNASISDEQDFGAVSSRESIESDRERLERQREQYVQIEPTAVPTGGGRGASVVKFALSTTNRVGEALYRRSTVFAKARFIKNCLKYPSPDLAQAEFLRTGGPQKDRKGLDPDGDGFACSWDPEPFRNAKAN